MATILGIPWRKEKYFIQEQWIKGSPDGYVKFQSVEDWDVSDKDSSMVYIYIWYNGI